MSHTVGRCILLNVEVTATWIKNQVTFALTFVAFPVWERRRYVHFD